MCDDVHPTVADLKRKGVEFTSEIAEARWGLTTAFETPAGDRWCCTSRGIHGPTRRPADADKSARCHGRLRLARDGRVSKTCRRARCDDRRASRLTEPRSRKHGAKRARPFLASMHPARVSGSIR
jgi:hypothetical protein